MQEQEKIPVWVQIVNGKTVCICHRGRKGCKSPARRTLSLAISLLGGKALCVVIVSVAEKVL